MEMGGFDENGGFWGVLGGFEVFLMGKWVFLR
jgi:hypothetical protein